MISRNLCCQISTLLQKLSLLQTCVHPKIAKSIQLNPLIISLNFAVRFANCENSTSRGRGRGELWNSNLCSKSQCGFQIFKKMYFAHFCNPKIKDTFLFTSNCVQREKYICQWLSTIRKLQHH